MNKRIKKLRKALNLTQREFGERIGVKPNTIATYEIGRNVPIDAVISLICREFNVSESWLRSGEGEMFVQTDSFDLNDYAKQCGASELDLQIIKLYLELPSNIRKNLIDHFRSGLQPQQSQQEFHFPETIDEKVAEYRRQLEDEEKVAEGSLESWSQDNDTTTKMA